jgi:hypothetical protein
MENVWPSDWMQDSIIVQLLATDSESGECEGAQRRQTVKYGHWVPWDAEPVIAVLERASVKSTVVSGGEGLLMSECPPESTPPPP